MIANPPNVPSAPNTRGQLFAGGIVFAFALSFIVGGIGLLSGLDAFEACRNGLATFLVIGLMGWLAELLIGPSLQRVVEEREREAAERAVTSIGGATVPETPLLSGGAPAPTPIALPPVSLGGRRYGRPVLVNIPASLAAAPGPSPSAGAPVLGRPGESGLRGASMSGREAGQAVGTAGAATGWKGRRLDVTLPEESAMAAPAPVAAMAAGQPLAPAAPASAGPAAGATPSIPVPVGGAPASPPAAGPETAGPAAYTTVDNEFEDLAPLLRGAGAASPRG